MKEKPPFYKLKLCERIVDIELLVLLLYAIIFIVIIWKRGGQFMWYDVLINIGSGILSSIAVTLFIYFKFLKHVPEETEKKINALLNARLGYETTNHNAVMAAVNPSNAYLSQEHTRLSQEHQQLNAGISSIDKVISVEIQKRADWQNNLTAEQRTISEHINALSALSDQMKSLQTENKELKREITGLRLENQHLSERLQQNRQNISRGPNLSL